MTKTTIGLGTLAIVLGTAGIFAGTALAYQGDPSTPCPNHSGERHEAMENALETNNYEAWKNLMQGKGRISQVITEQNFSKFAEIHKLMEEGKVAEAQQIRQELGLGLQNGQGKGAGMHRGMNR